MKKIILVSMFIFVLFACEQNGIIRNSQDGRVPNISKNIPDSEITPPKKDTIKEKVEPPQEAELPQKTDTPQEAEVPKETDTPQKAEDPKEEEDFIDRLSTRYGRQFLLKMKDGEKRVALYDKFDKACKDFFLDTTSDVSGAQLALCSESIADTLGDANKAKSVYRVFRYDNPQYYFLKDEDAFAFTKIGCVTDEEFAKASERKKILQELKLLLQELDLQKNASLSQKIDYIWDKSIAIAYAQQNMEADHRTKYHSFVRPLLEKKAICEGYAHFFNLMCNYLNVESLLVAGEISGGTNSGRNEKHA